MKTPVPNKFVWQKNLVRQDSAAVHTCLQPFELTRFDVIKIRSSMISKIVKIFCLFLFLTGISNSSTLKAACPQYGNHTITIRSSDQDILNQLMDVVQKYFQIDKETLYSSMADQSLVFTKQYSNDRTSWLIDFRGIMITVILEMPWNDSTHNTRQFSDNRKVI